MKVSEWLEAGIDPPIGSVQQWIVDHLGLAGAEEEACFALRDGRDTVRILVATDIGLFDFRWGLDAHELTGVHHRWADVEDLRLTGHTGVAPDLGRRPPTWSLALGSPAIAIPATDHATAATALLDLWRACRAAMDGAR